MGKSTATRLLRERGVSVVDTDDLARHVVQPGQPALEEICQAFGADLKDPSGQLRRGALAEIVFKDASARATLEAITHPRIAALWQQQLDVWKREGRSSAVVVIPLLFETGAERHFDSVICIACSSASQHDRLSARGWTAEHIRQRLAAQWRIDDKITRSHFVVWTEGEITTTAAQLAKIIPA